MANQAVLADTLDDFTTATQSALQGLPKSSAILPVENGISLLDAKNELFLSYLQALALRNLSVVRSLKDGSSLEETQKLNDMTTRKLVEHRVYLERGVKPLEQKIKYQVDRVIKAVDDEERASQQKKSRVGKPVNGHSKADGNESGESSENDSEEDDGSDVSVDATIKEASYRPNAAGFAQAGDSEEYQERRAKSKVDGVYRPPRISATSMPTTESRERKERRPGRSATLDEYVSTELSNAPLAQPSIGSTIAAGGRKNKDARQLAKEQERRDYEESNLLRLPKESKKERAKQSRRDKGGGFGGEEWRGLGESVDRIGDLTRRKHKEGALEKSRKRRAVEDGPRGDGTGDTFDVKKRRLMKKMGRK